MALRIIRKNKDPILRKECRKVDKIDIRTCEILDDMAETMYNAEGIGLAAPQIGVLRQIVVIDVGEGLIELINPEIIDESGEQFQLEGCLSLPDITRYVSRPVNIKVQALNRRGEIILIQGSELLARALSHEIDHIHGVLFLDKAIKDEVMECDD